MTQSLLKTLVANKTKAKHKENQKKRKFFTEEYIKLLKKKPDLTDVKEEFDESKMMLAKDWLTDRIVLETKLIELGVTEDELKEYSTRLLK